MKFHLIAEPSRPPVCFFRNANTGCVALPFTLTLADNGKSTPYDARQNSSISAALPGSWCANWSHGNPITTRPWSAYASWMAWRPSYWG